MAPHTAQATLGMFGKTQAHGITYTLLGMWDETTHGATRMEDTLMVRFGAPSMDKGLWQAHTMSACTQGGLLIRRNMSTTGRD